MPSKRRKKGVRVERVVKERYQLDLGESVGIYDMKKESTVHLLGRILGGHPQPEEKKEQQKEVGAAAVSPSSFSSREVKAIEFIPVEVKVDPNRRVRPFPSKNAAPFQNKALVGLAEEKNIFVDIDNNLEGGLYVYRYVLSVNGEYVPLPRQKATAWHQSLDEGVSREAQTQQRIASLTEQLQRCREERVHQLIARVHARNGGAYISDDHRDSLGENDPTVPPEMVEAELEMFGLDEAFKENEVKQGPGAWLHSVPHI
uniref:Ubiquitin-like domain-containing protein n=1 Tax=Chromera velia CCMP2878 TaxID=1169474 RepID=A0A0G4I713_9ALVE|eukprot:Cvel_11546.t1-p1 / transcript=Cvel_11546.t1 / gene=Cvel_11546 / organism=Chromera_velia_CCMP2878 / gene_product=hypothetical protein / transcript_product=hypothetical protein / location=Cvel_scaffold729:33486-34256(-) / protein_length=257 / sequence_SO=supercontig / SO=protein_coding / is_pseudo=false